MLCSGAGEAPGNVVAEPEGPTEISVQWRGLSTCRLVNGAIAKYRVQYRVTGWNESRQEDVEADGDWREGGSVVLTELTPLTSYSISVAAVNENGDVGVFSEPVTVNYCKNIKLHFLLFFISLKLVVVVTSCGAVAQSPSLWESLLVWLV